MDLHGILEKVKSVSRKIGEYQKAEFRSLPAGGGDEKAEREFVSHIDLESEKQFREGLAAILPQAGFYGEETARERGEEYTWVVDPLDGTTNYLSGLDHWSVSTALLRRDEPILSVVLKPSTEETFCAIRNMGAYHNNQRMRSVPELALQSGLIGTGFPYRSPDTTAQFFSCAGEVLTASRGLRRLGSAALDLCYVAAGFLQGFFEVDLEAYDVAAALLFLHETGCPVSDFAGNEYSLFESRSLCAGFPGLQHELQQICARHYGESR